IPSSLLLPDPAQSESKHCNSSSLGTSMSFMLSFNTPNETTCQTTLSLSLSLSLLLSVSPHKEMLHLCKETAPSTQTHKHSHWFHEALLESAVCRAGLEDS